MRRELFGTDGIRGRANEEPMSVDTILRVARAAACVFRKDRSRRHRVIIAKDTRLSGYMFEQALASGFCSMGVDVWLTGPLPTPAVAYLTRSMRADAGAMISASHNPFEDNGLKFFGPDGFKLSDEVEAEIEELVQSEKSLNQERPEAGLVGRAVRLDDARGRYISYLKHRFPDDLTLEGKKIVLDCAHGATYRIAPSIFSELGAQVVLLGVDPNGKNINDRCGAVYPDEMMTKVCSVGADMGFAFDGDGDRLVFCDEKGELFDGDDVLAILAQPMQSRGEIGGGIVGTLMTNYGLEKYLQSLSIPFYRASVGDRYVVEKMRETGSILGGEPSGHVVCLKDSTTGDGILSALLVAAELQRKEAEASDCRGVFQRYPQVLRNVWVREKKEFSQVPKIQSMIAHAQKEIEGKGRVLVRYSGTEKKARVMVEGESISLVENLAKKIAETIEKEIGDRP